MWPLLIPPAIAICVLAGCYGVWMLRTAQPTDLLEPRPVVRRRTTNRGSRVDQIMEGLGRPLVPLAVKAFGPGWVEANRRRLAAAGEPSRPATDRFLARKIGTGLIGTLAAVTIVLQGHPFIGLVFAVLGWLVLDLWLRSKASRRQGDIQRELPDFLDVLAVTLGAGLSFRAAFGRVAEALGGALGEEVRSTLNAIDVGVSRRTALDEMRNRNSSRTLRRFIAAVLQSEELGTPLAAVVADQAQEMRRERAREARRRAGRADPQVTVVAALFFLPGAAILLLTAFALVMFRDIGSLFNF